MDVVSFRNVVLRLNQHLRHYFPAYLGHLSSAQRWAHLHALATTAYDRGFSSELDITLYANVHGYLGEHALQEHPDLQRQLMTASSLTPAQRIEKVAEIARCRALHLREPALCQSPFGLKIPTTSTSPETMRAIAWAPAR